jgi:hypothetical protein
MDSGEAFIPDPRGHGPARAQDQLAESLAEEYVEAATAAEDVRPEVNDEVFTEEVGGPFVEAPGGMEESEEEEEEAEEPLAEETLETKPAHAPRPSERVAPPPTATAKGRGT